MKYFLMILLFAGAFLLGAFFEGRKHGKESATVQRDTVIIRDTLLADIPPPVIKEVIKYDTVTIRGRRDTLTIRDSIKVIDSNKVVIPIEQKAYQTADYRAVISGWRPSLDSLQIYQDNITITNTITRYRNPRWAITVGAGVGYAPNKPVSPFVGVTAGYVIWSK